MIRADRHFLARADTLERALPTTHIGRPVGWLEAANDPLGHVTEALPTLAAACPTSTASAGGRPMGSVPGVLDCSSLHSSASSPPEQRDHA